MNITINTTIEVAAHNLIANDFIMQEHEELAKLDAQHKTLGKVIAARKEIIKNYMGKSQVLISMDGVELCTYKYNNPSEIVDKKKLLAQYPEVYNMIVELVAGSRVFNIK